MNIAIWPIEKVTPYARNARQIPAKAVEKVASSIREFGWRQPIVVDREGVIICGHVRLLAAQKLGLPEVPVHVADSLTPAQVRAYRLLDNRSHEETDWDEKLLGLELLELKDLGLDLSLTGFELDEIEDLLGPLTEGQTDSDAVPELPENPVSRSGDLWIAGNHRIVCADSRDIASFEHVLGGVSADMVFTDPPYNVDYHQTGSRAGRKIANDDLGVGFNEFLADVCRNLLFVTRGAIYVCMSSSELDRLKRAFTEAGGHWSTYIIWAKNTFTLGRADYQRQYEPILYGWKEGDHRYWCGARDQGDVWFMNKPVANDLHPTMKPVEMVERAIANSSKPGATVLDAFGGSGTTIIAAERTRRHARVIEVDPKYVDVAVRRWQDFTGKNAFREGSGETFGECSEVRGRDQGLSEARH
jgi:DNA modification methylase